MDDPPRHEEAREEDRERVGVRSPAVEVELEKPEQGPHPHALQAVGAAGERVGAVRRLGEEQAEAEREHDEREMAKAHDDVAAEVAGNSARERGEREAAQRLAPAVLRGEPGRVGAEAEVGRVPERHEPGIAEDEVQREREKRGDGDLARELQVRRRHDERQQRARPEDKLRPAPARARGKGGLSAGQTGPPDATSAVRPSRGR